MKEASLELRVTADRINNGIDRCLIRARIHDEAVGYRQRFIDFEEIKRLQQLQYEHIDDATAMAILQVPKAVYSQDTLRTFAQALCDWVLPTMAQQVPLEAFATQLDAIGCAKWPVLTSYRFLLHPNADALIKLENPQKAAILCGFEINLSNHRQQ